VAKIKELLEREKNIPLNIGITGESGSGKSTFVNAFRGIDNKHEGAAPTGCEETTMEAKPYPHPNYPNVTLWDLPGIGTPDFSADKYLELVEFKKFDFFIIISDTRFRENDVKLAQEIKKMEKRFYFVRSKIDHNLQDENRSQREFNKERTLSKIRENCIQGLEQAGVVSPQVFLVASFDLQLYDFALLLNTLENKEAFHNKIKYVATDLSPDLIAVALDLQVLPGPGLHGATSIRLRLSSGVSFSNYNIRRRRCRIQFGREDCWWAFQPLTDIHDELKRRRVCWATVSAAVAAVPVPGLSIAVDVGILVGVVKEYVLRFGLDILSLKRLSDRTNVPFDDLIAVIISQLAATEITSDLLLKVIGQQSGSALLMAAEEVSRFIPILGIPVAMTLSFKSTYNILKIILNMLAEDAQSVFKRALGLNSLV
ncbi:T-cell-specific guanine nucleotide triphosphate-binding protein 2-like, partial [Sander lucioperca]|uniref:T-cell-specific guanine nucleotide triphosphate-binding protein 2-like n=1 Tax=Sander lucioperca TaxID=283035 RepID=UPI001653740A